MNIKHLQLIEEMGLQIDAAPNKIKENIKNFQELNSLIEIQKQELNEETNEDKISEIVSEVKNAETLLYKIDSDLCTLVVKWDNNKEMYAARALKMKEGRMKKKNNDGGAISNAKIVVPKESKPLTISKIEPTHENTGFSSVSGEERSYDKELEIVENEAPKNIEQNPIKIEQIDTIQKVIESEQVKFEQPKQLKPPASTKTKSNWGWYVIAGGVALITLGSVILKKD